MLHATRQITGLSLPHQHTTYPFPLLDLSHPHPNSISKCGDASSRNRSVISLAVISHRLIEMVEIKLHLMESLRRLKLDTTSICCTCGPTCISNIEHEGIGCMKPQTFICPFFSSFFLFILLFFFFKQRTREVVRPLRTSIAGFPGHLNSYIIVTSSSEAITQKPSWQLLHNLICFRCQRPS
jgi:hypothetical protein